MADKTTEELLESILGKGEELGEGDLTLATRPMPAPVRRNRATTDWEAGIYAVRADLSPAVGLRFRAWAVRQQELVAGLSLSEQLGAYLELATLRDTMTDELRPLGEREYDWEELHLSGVRPLIEREMQAQREVLAAGMAEAILAQIQPFVDQGLVPAEVLSFLRGPVPDGR